MRALAAPTRRPVVLPPVRPNLGVEAAYRRRLDALIEEMQHHVMAAVTTAYLANPPRLAADEAPASAFVAMMARLGREWRRKFEEFAQHESRRFTGQATGHTDRSFAEALRQAGFTVRFTMTPEARDVMQATIAEQVGLIRSIPAEMLTQVQGAVMRSVQVGHDLGTLSTELQQQFGVTKRRAALIARDQNAKANASMMRVRQEALGITHAVWLHSAGGRVPRETHVLQSGKPYDVRVGWLDPAVGKRIWPGTEINCFPGDMTVSLETGPLILWRAPFNGPMVHIHVGSDLLKGTSNHPILTSRGWIALGQLNDGDQVVCMVKDSRHVVGHNKDHTKTTFHDLFEASRVGGVNVRRRCGGFHFYGDIADCDIDEIILSHDELPLGRHSSGCKNNSDFLFSDADCMSLSAGFGSINQIAAPNTTRFDGDLLTFSGVGLCESVAIRGAAASHQSPASQNITDVAGGMTRHTQAISDCGGADASLIETFDLVAEQIPVSSAINQNADGAELFAQFVRIMSNNDCRIFEFGSRLYELRRVSDKSIRNFSGHVFTMQTSAGYYSAGSASVQAKNCRCVSKAIIPGLE